jgi:Fe-S-cluster containining protein
MIEERYLDIVASVDEEFARNRRLHGAKINCRGGCTECCYQLFQITEIEAAHISEGIQKLEPEKREALRTRAREYTEARRRLVTEQGESESWGNLPPSGTRLACPALDDGVCAIYEFRPLMCHKFGMPLYNPDKPDQVFACELNFKNGEEIEDSKLIQIQTSLHRAWKELQSDYNRAGGYRDPEPLTVARCILEDSWRRGEKAASSPAGPAM